MVSVQGQSLYGGSRGFVRVESEEKQPPLREVQGSGVKPVSTPPFETDSSDDGTSAFGIAWRFRKVQVSPVLGTILLYMAVSMSLTLLDKWLITGLGFDAPLCLIMLTYFIMHLVSALIRACSRRQRGSSGGEKQVLLQTLTRSQWAWKVFPVAAASGLEVGTSALGLQVMHVGVHTMVRSTVPIFVLLFSVGMGLQEFRVALVVVVLLVSAGVSLLFAGQKHDNQETFPMFGFLLTLLSGMLAGLKWTLSQVLLQGRGLCGKGYKVVDEVIHPFTLLHYMSLSSAATLVPFVAVLEVENLREMAIAFGTARIIKTALLIVAASLLALVLVLTEFSFIKRVSSLGLCIIGVVKELLLVLFSVGFLGEHLGGRSCLGFFITMVGVALYKLVPKRSPEASRREGTTDPGAAASSTPSNKAGREAPDHPLLLAGTSSDARQIHVDNFSLEPKLVNSREGSGRGDAKAYRRELHGAGASEIGGGGVPDSAASNA